MINLNSKRYVGRQRSGAASTDVGIELGYALVEATIESQIDFARKIFRSGREINSRGLGNAINVAIGKGEIDFAREIFHSGREIHSGPLGNALRNAIGKGQMDFAREMLERLVLQYISEGGETVRILKEFKDIELPQEFIREQLGRVDEPKLKEELESRLIVQRLADAAREIGSDARAVGVREGEGSRGARGEGDGRGARGRGDR